MNHYVENKFVNVGQKNGLPPITFCNICASSNVTLETNDLVYHGKLFGAYPFIYLCNDCESYVGIHPNTNTPLGTLATAEMRAARKRVKTKFIDWYELKGWNRGKAYSKLAKALNIDGSECHFGWFDVDACNDAEKFLDAELKVEREEFYQQIGYIPQNNS
jgi:hypothetical protein